jgi:hypothetical protein
MIDTSRAAQSMLPGPQGHGKVGEQGVAKP